MALLEKSKKPVGMIDEVFNKIDKKVRTCIYLSLTNEFVTEVEDETTMT